MRQSRQLCGQNAYFFMDRFMLVHDKQILTLHCAQSAFNLDTGRPQVLLGNGNLHAISQIDQFLIYLIGFHFIRVGEP